MQDWRHYKVFSCAVLKMTERFENWDNIFTQLGKDKVQNRFAEASSKFEKQEKKDKPFLLENDPGKTQAVSVGSQARLNHAQNWSW